MLDTSICKMPKSKGFGPKDPPYKVNDLILSRTGSVTVYQPGAFSSILSFSFHLHFRIFMFLG